MAEVVRVRGSVGELHARDPFAAGSPARSQVWWCRPTRAALTLGSRQDVGVVDVDASARAGVDIAHRRSGGGAVLVDPAATIWLDVVVPPGVVPDDVRASMETIGGWWRAALRPWLDAQSVRATLHRGGMVENEWSSLVCFAGVGPGELLVGDRKLVGLSQRRGRHGARFQGLVHVAEPRIGIADLLAGPLPARPMAVPAVVPALGEPGAAARLAMRLAAQIPSL